MSEAHNRYTVYINITPYDDNKALPFALEITMIHVPIYLLLRLTWLTTPTHIRY